MSKKKNKWVVYPEVELTIDDFNEYFNMQENEKVKPVDITFPETQLETEEKTMEGVEEELEKILDNEELSDEEKKAIYIEQLKESRKPFKPIKQKGNITTNQFGTAYKQKRKRKNKTTKASRRNNRK